MADHQDQRKERLQTDQIYKLCKKFMINKCKKFKKDWLILT
jgi:hypothetical protein